MTPGMSLRDLAEYLNAEVIGDGTVVISGINTLEKAGPGEIAFLANPRYASQLESCRADAVILRRAQADHYAGNALVVDNPYLAYASASAKFAPQLNQSAGIHPTAVVSDSAQIHPESSIGPHVVIDASVVIGEGVVIGAGTVIGENSSVGKGTRIYPNVTIYHGVTIGESVTIHGNTVIGADGFGFAPAGENGWVKIHQLGGVRIGNNVEIGACTTIDRGAIEDTEIGDNVILDNHIQIAHNVKVGRNTAMAAYTGVSGSTVIGENCLFGGKTGIAGHLTICSGVQTAGRTIITKSITEPGSYSSGTRFSKTSEWRKNAARFNQLDDMARKLASLENKINQTEE
ncbi:MAG: UDP-3-O-(3-hydroxymyristoyl)glucosamine N-acyltransferase [bacterium]